MKRLLCTLLIVCVQSAALAQPPLPVSIETEVSSECATLTQQIMAKQASIAFLNTRIASSQAACTAAEVDYYTAIANMLNYPLYAQMYQMMAVYCMSQIVYWAGEVADDKFLKGIKQSELDALLLQYSQAGC